MHQTTRTIELKSPEEIIAHRIALADGADCMDAAKDIVAELNRRGYRIVREKIPNTESIVA